VTQQNAALVEEAAAAAEAIVEQAQNLNSMIARYRLDDSASTARAASAASSPVVAERRGAARPWTGSQPKAAGGARTGRPASPAKPAGLAPKAVATATAAGSDTDWHEF